MLIASSALAGRVVEPASPRTAADTEAPRFHTLDALRGYAAVAVVLFHCAMTYYPAVRPPWLNKTPLRLLIAGPSAVFVFFALSGFVLFLAFAGRKRVEYGPFIVKRFMRLYPPFAAAIFASALLWLGVHPQPIAALNEWFNASWSLAPTLKVVLGHLAMTDRPELHSLDNVMWSLCIEARISLVFPLIALLVKRSWAWCAAAAVAFTLAVSLSGAAAYAWAFNPFSTLQYVVLFVGGAALALNARAIRDFVAALPLWVSLSTWAAALTALSFTPAPRLVLVSDLAALVVIALCFGDRRAAPVFLNPVAQWLGRVSYSLYLVHLPIVLALVHLLWGKIPLQAILLLAVVLALAGAELSYRFIEVPSIRLARYLVQRMAHVSNAARRPLGAISKAAE